MAEAADSASHEVVPVYLYCNCARYPELLGDLFAELVLYQLPTLTEAMKKQYVQVFLERFREPPPIHGYTWDWLKIIGRFGYMTDDIADAVVRTWQAQPRSGYVQRLVLLETMAGNPHPLYRPILKKVGKSRVSDLSEEAERALAELDQVEGEAASKGESPARELQGGREARGYKNKVAATCHYPTRVRRTPPICSFRWGHCRLSGRRASKHRRCSSHRTEKPFTSLRVVSPSGSSPRTMVSTMSGARPARRSVLAT
jgi:hypothetical protein